MTATGAKKVRNGEIPEGWRSLQWGDLATLEYGKGLRNYSQVGKYPVYGTNGQIGYCDQCLSGSPGVIIGRKGAYRGVHYSKGPFFVIDTAFYLKPKQDNLDLRFAYYELLKQDINSLDTGSAIPSTTRESFYSLQVLLPPLSEQRVIAKVLSDLDAKIELNHQMNKTLESIAQAIFKQWFVDFKFPGHEKTKFVNGLPEGWREGNLVDTCEIIMGQSPPGETYNESGDGIAFYQGNRDFGFRYPSTRVYCTAPTRIAEAGDVLISVRAPVGALNITLGQCAIGRGVAALRMKHYSNGFLYYFLLTQNNLWDRYNSEGTVFGCLNKAEFHKMQVIIPSDKVMALFDEIITPIQAMIQSREEESRALTQIRDSLLPRLMSGKIRVKE